MAGRVEIRNNMAIVGWIFMSIWMGMLLLITWLFVRDGGFHQFDPLVETGIMLLFWVFGLGGSAELFGRPRVRFVIEGGEVDVTERWLLRSRHETFPLADLAEPKLISDRDSDGDPYYRCGLVLPSGRKISVRESHDRATIEAECDRIKAAIA